MFGVGVEGMKTPGDVIVEKIEKFKTAQETSEHMVMREKRVKTSEGKTLSSVAQITRNKPVKFLPPRKVV